VRRFPILIVLLACTAAACAGENPAPQAAGLGEFREGWRQAAGPVQKTEGKGALTARQEALLAAIPLFEAAAAADPGNTYYRVGLGYTYLAAGRYQQAKETIDQAVGRDRKDPLLYLLRAQAEAALAYMNPQTKAKEIDTALRSFDDAAHLDPANSLALIQAASVAFEVGKQEVALAKLEAGLARPAMTLYRLPIPGDLGPSPLEYAASRAKITEGLLPGLWWERLKPECQDKCQKMCQAESIKMWQYTQMSQWGEMVARCQNAARMTLKHGKGKEDAGDLAGAEAAYKQALALGRQVGNAQPNLFITVSVSLNLMEDAYTNLARVADAKKSREVEAWKGEAGVISIAREELFAKLQSYMKRLDEGPPASIEADLALEAESVARPMLGVGLSPTYKAPHIPEGAGAESPAPPPQGPKASPGSAETK